MYALGILTGITLSILILLIEVRKSPDIVRRLEVKLRKKPEGGSVIHMPTDEEQAQEEIMRRNDE